MIDVTTEGMLLTAVSKPYSMNGTEGVSHRVRVLINGDIYACKSNANQVESLKGALGSMGKITLRFKSPKETLGVEFIGFK